MINPFNPRYPIDPEFFANRKKEIERFERDLKRTLDSKLPENVAILGDWGIGKSSLAYRFAHISANKEGARILSTGLSIPRTIRSMDEFCFLLLNKLNQDIASSENITNKLRNEIKKWRMKTLGIGPFEMERREEEIPKIPFALLQTHLIELWKDYLSKESVDAVAIIIDDIHHLVNAVKGGILDLRSIFQEMPRYKCCYLLIITGSKTLFGDVRDLAEPMVRFFGTYEIENLDLNETRELITFPLKKAGSEVRVTEDVIKAIYERTKGHPYFIAFFMQILLERCKNNIIDLSLYNAILPILSRGLEIQKFEKDLRTASEMERELLFRTSKFKEDEFSFSDISSPKRKSMIAGLLDRLVEKNLIIKIGRGKYKLYHPLFKEYIKTKTVNRT